MIGRKINRQDGKRICEAFEACLDEINKALGMEELAEKFAADTYLSDAEDSVEECYIMRQWFEKEIRYNNKLSSADPYTPQIKHLFGKATEMLNDPANSALFADNRNPFDFPAEIADAFPYPLKQELAKLIALGNAKLLEHQSKGLVITHANLYQPVRKDSERSEILDHLRGRLTP